MHYARSKKSLDTIASACNFFSVLCDVNIINLHKKLSYRFFPIMGVTVSSQRQKKVVKRVPPPSFASFSTTGTLTTSAHVDEGETESKIVLSKLKIRQIRLYKIDFIHFCF